VAHTRPGLLQRVTERKRDQFQGGSNARVVCSR
jgi:hypothetical protein